MPTLVQLVLTHAVAVALLGVAVAGLSRVWRRPSVCHALWVLLLIKLLVPPLVAVPLPAFPAFNPQPDWRPDESLERFLVQADVTAVQTERPTKTDTSLLFEAARADDAPERPLRALGPWDWAALLAAAGSAVYGLAVLRRARRFGRLLAATGGAPRPLRRMSCRLARALRLRRCPRLSYVPGRLSPLVWGVGRRTRVVLPQELFDRLAPASQRAILAHELAHVRRGDPWVRLLETAVAILYWWNPFIWWARRELRVLEELSCDALAVRAQAGSAQAYATALVDTVDFLAGAPAISPPAASGVSANRHLKRRIEMVMRNEVRPSSRILSWMVLAGAVVCLPLGFTWAQEEKSPPTEQADVALTQKQRKELIVELQAPDTERPGRRAVVRALVGAVERAVDASGDRPVSITIRFADGREKIIQLDEGQLDYLGDQPRKVPADAGAADEATQRSRRDTKSGEAADAVEAARKAKAALAEALAGLQAAEAAQEQAERGLTKAEIAALMARYAEALRKATVRDRLEAEFQGHYDEALQQAKKLKDQFRKELESRLRARFEDGDLSRKGDGNAARSDWKLNEAAAQAEQAKRLDRLEEMMQQIQRELKELREHQVPGDASSASERDPDELRDPGDPSEPTGE